MSGSEDSTATAAAAILESASASASANKPMDRSGGKPQSNDDLLGDMINSAAMSILDGEDFTMGPVQVKTRTGKKKDHVKRPMNAFMVYAQVARKLISKSNSNLQNSEISKKLGELWRRTDDVSKRAFIEKAELLRQNHKKEHPDYKYQPRRKKSKANGGSRCRSPNGGGVEEEITQNPIKGRQTAKGSSGNKAMSTSARSGASSQKVFNSNNHCGPAGSHKGINTNNNNTRSTANIPKETTNSPSSSSSSISSSTSATSLAYSNYLYGFPGKPYYHPHHHQNQQPLLGCTAATTIPASPAHSQTSVHSSLSTTPPTTPGNLLPGQTSVSSPRTYGYAPNSYEMLQPKHEQEAQTSPMSLSSSRVALGSVNASADWYQKNDEQYPNYAQSSNGWTMNYAGGGGGYSHPAAVLATSASGQATTFQGGNNGIMETDVDPKELEQYLDNPAAARKVPSSVYTIHTRDEMYLDLQPGVNSVSGNGSCGMQTAPLTAAAHLQPVGGDPSMTTRIHNPNEYYVISGDVGGGYEGRYKEFY